MTSPTSRTTFRPTRTRAVLLTAGSVAFGMFTLIAVLLPADGARPWGLGDRLAFAGTGVLILAVLAWLSRPKVVVEPDGITVVNLVTRRRLAWAEIVRVNLRHGDAWVHLDLADGTSLAAMGIQPGVGREQALRDARALRALTEEHGTAAEEPIS